jgi:lipoate-protein ligase A
MEVHLPGLRRKAPESPGGGLIQDAGERGNLPARLHPPSNPAPPGRPAVPGDASAPRRRQAAVSEPRAVWRLLIDPPQDGFRNMALDEALLERCRRGNLEDAFPALRLYSWSVPTLSLGRFQDALRAVDQGFCRERGIPVVRRPTGGAAVLHDRELTYCLVGPSQAPPFDGSLLGSYRRIARGIARGLSLLGLEPDPASPAPCMDRRHHPEQCFARVSSYETTFLGHKVVGSAQVRRKGASLQHGSILLDVQEGLFDQATGGQQGERRGWTTLRTLLGHSPVIEEVAVALARGIGESFGVGWKLEEAAAEEAALAEKLRVRKYLNAHWNARGSAALSRT